MKLIKPAPPIHPAFNPVIFGFKGVPDTTETLYIIAGDEQIAADIDFDETGMGEIEISGILKSLFGKLKQSESSVIVDDYLSFAYQIKESLSNNETLGTYTAVRSASQIRETQDLTILKGKLLTGFDKLYAYDSDIYKTDVSILGNNTTHNGEPLTINRINRLAYSCADNFVPILAECTLEWDTENTVCQEVENNYIFHAPGSYGFSATGGSANRPVDSYLNNPSNKVPFKITNAPYWLDCVITESIEPSDYTHTVKMTCADNFTEDVRAVNLLLAQDGSEKTISTPVTQAKFGFSENMDLHVGWASSEPIKLDQEWDSYQDNQGNPIPFSTSIDVSWCSITVTENEFNSPYTHTLNIELQLNKEEAMRYCHITLVQDITGKSRVITIEQDF